MRLTERYVCVRPACILAWITGALGDTLLSFPALQALRVWAPNAEIVAIGRREYLGLGVDLGIVDRVEDSDGPLATSLFGAARRASSLPYQLAVVWSSVFAELEAALLERGVDTVIASFPRGGHGMHQSDYLVSCLAPLAIERSNRLPRWRPPCRPAAGDAILPSPLARSVLIHAGAGASWKRWPLHSCLVLAAKLRAAGHSVCWSCGEADAGLRERITASEPPADLLPELTVRELASVVSRSRLVVSADTGIAHLAALCGTPSLTLFGPTDARRWQPLGPLAGLIEAPDLCGGSWLCSVPPSDRAPEPRMRRCAPASALSCACLAAVPPETVLDRCLAVLTAQGT